MLFQKRAAARFTLTTEVDERALPPGKEEAVAIFDQERQGPARTVSGVNLGLGLFGFDQRLVQLLEGERVVEQRRVDHALRDRQFLGRQRHRCRALVRLFVIAGRHHDSAGCGHAGRAPPTQRAVDASSGEEHFSAKGGPRGSVNRERGNEPGIQRQVHDERGSAHRGIRTLAVPADELMRQRVVERQQRKRQRQDPERRHSRRVARSVEQRNQPRRRRPQRERRRHGKRRDARRHPHDRPPVGRPAQVGKGNRQHRGRKQP